jgi:hypothetical protein
MSQPYQIRLNGFAVTSVKIRPAMVEIDGCLEPIGDNEVVACTEDIGEFAIDDNENNWDASLPKFVLEIRDTNIPPAERRNLPNKGWVRVTAKEFLNRLSTMGVIQ